MDEQKDNSVDDATDENASPSDQWLRQLKKAKTCCQNIASMEDKDKVQQLVNDHLQQFQETFDKAIELAPGHKETKLTRDIAAKMSEKLANKYKALAGNITIDEKNLGETFFASFTEIATNYRGTVNTASDFVIIRIISVFAAWFLVSYTLNKVMLVIPDGGMATYQHVLIFILVSCYSLFQTAYIEVTLRTVNIAAVAVGFVFIFVTFYIFTLLSDAILWVEIFSTIYAGDFANNLTTIVFWNKYGTTLYLPVYVMLVLYAIAPPDSSSEL